MRRAQVRGGVDSPLDEMLSAFWRLKISFARAASSASSVWTEMRMLQASADGGCGSVTKRSSPGAAIGTVESSEDLAAQLAARLRGTEQRRTRAQRHPEPEHFQPDGRPRPSAGPEHPRCGTEDAARHGQAESQIDQRHSRAPWDGIVPRKAPDSRPRASMNFLNRSRSPFARCDTTPSASPTFSIKPSGS